LVIVFVFLLNVVESVVYNPIFLLLQTENPTAIMPSVVGETISVEENMGMKGAGLDISRQIHKFVTAGFKPRFGRLKRTFRTDPLWSRLLELGSELWLDTGSIEDAWKFWTQEFSALTTNNTLLNKEVQTGRYDSLIIEADRMLASAGEVSEEKRTLEIAFILNAWHGLRLVEKFDAYVSVEEHTALAETIEGAVNYAKRFHTVCPQRFIIKIPFTPAGLLATRKISAEGVAVNHTLGFSARQNYVIARIGKPAYVNVFLGRLNSFVADNNLGDGAYIGEKATIASQIAVRKLRRWNLSPSRQIGASFRAGPQVRDLAGIDVMTMPPKVAGQFRDLSFTPDQISDKTATDYKLGVNPEVDIDAIRLNTLWDIDDALISCVDALEKENLDKFTPNDLVDFFNEYRCGDVMVRWSDSQIQTSTQEGKIPRVDNWRDALADGSIGLDSLMNLAGLCSFDLDQKAMDERVRQVLASR
jgi:transaldolase